MAITLGIRSESWNLVYFGLFPFASKKFNHLVPEKKTFNFERPEFVDFGPIFQSFLHIKISDIHFPSVVYSVLVGGETKMDMNARFIIKIRIRDSCSFANAAALRVAQMWEGKNGCIRSFSFRKKL